MSDKERIELIRKELKNTIEVLESLIKEENGDAYIAGRNDGYKLAIKNIKLDLYVLGGK